MALHTLPNELLLLVTENLGAKDLKHLLESNRRLLFTLTPQLHKLAYQPIGSIPSLHWGVLHDYLPLVTLLLNSPNKEDIINSTCETGFTALHYAAAEGRTHMVQFLLSKGADPTRCDYIDQTALVVATSFASKQRFPLLIFPAYRSKPPYASWHKWAGDGEYQTICRLLLEYGAPKDGFCRFGRTPLHWAVRVRNAGIVRLLLDAGADVDLPTRDGETPLMWAVTYSGSMDEDTVEDIVSILLSHGAQVDWAGSTGYTTLHLAAWGGLVGAATLLLEHGAELDVKNLQDGSLRTPLHHAVMGMGMGKDSAVFFKLLEAGADCDIADFTGDTALHLAASNGLVECVKALFDRGADRNKRNVEGNTAFQSIITRYEGEDKEIAREILTQMFLEKEREEEEEEIRVRDPVKEVRLEGVVFEDASVEVLG